MGVSEYLIKNIEGLLKRVSHVLSTLSSNARMIEFYRKYKSLVILPPPVAKLVQDMTASCGKSGEGFDYGE